MENFFKIANEYLKGNDLEFFKRVWSSSLLQYEKRIKAINFTELNHVLDAGFGMGQWLVKLGELNKRVSGIEYSADRVNAVQLIIDKSNLSNIEILQGSIESLPYNENTFDAVFCYGVIFITDYRKAIKEFTRVLKPGGKLYFTGNDLGWYLFCLIEQHNKSENYDPRQMAISTIQNSIQYYSESKINIGEQIIINRNIIQKELKELGFNEIIVKSEGHINFMNESETNSFYKQTNYLNEGFIFEVHATKREN